MFILWKLEWMKILFKLTFNGEIATALLEYNCFDYYFQVLLVNVSVWIFMWILTLLSTLNNFVKLPTLKYYDSQGLNEWETEINRRDHENFLRKGTEPWNI